MRKIKLLFHRKLIAVNITFVPVVLFCLFFKQNTKAWNNRKTFPGKKAKRG